LQLMRKTVGYCVLVGVSLGVVVFVGAGRAEPQRTACGVTLPNGKHPPGTLAGPDWYGNGKLFTPLWPHGVLLADSRFVNPDGSIGMKFPWWGIHVPPKILRIRGHRLDVPGRLRARVNWGAPPGYRGSFWASSITFARPGCWEVNGQVGKVRLTFVILVSAVPT
jgi:hypothetical protein